VSNKQEKNSPQSSEVIFNDFVQSLIPNGAASISVHHFAKQLCCTPGHVINLIKEGAIVVPESELELARTKKKSWTVVRIPRASAISFLRMRSRLPNKSRKAKRG
jgi:hypothetical protein